MKEKTVTSLSLNRILFDASPGGEIAGHRKDSTEIAWRVEEMAETA